LSAHIAKVKGTVEVPDYFNVALDRVISVRSAFSHKLAAAGEAVDKSSDDRHSFFVTVLESVRDALKPLMRNDALDLNSIKNATPRSGKDRVRQTGLRNIFEVLDVYEPSAEFLAAPDVVPPPKPMKLDYTAEVLTDSVIDAFMAMTMLMDDLSRLRAEIADLWGRHHAGELDLATVSVATNTAIQLAHSMHDEVYPVMKHLVESVPFHEVYFLAIAKEAGGTTTTSKPTTSQTPCSTTPVMASWSTFTTISPRPVQSWTTMANGVDSMKMRVHHPERTSKSMPAISRR